MKHIQSKLLALSVITLISVGTLTNAKAEEVSMNESAESSELSSNLTDTNLTTEFDISSGNFTPMYHHRGRGGRGDHDRGGWGHGHDRYYPPPHRHYPPPHRHYPPPPPPHRHYPPPPPHYYPPDRGGYYGCNDQSVTLLCKINGVHNYITAYTNCGYSNEGSSCYNVSTPGYYQVSMRIHYRCERGQWIWMLGNNGQCKLSY